MKNTLSCKAAQSHFSGYLDGAVTGTEMQSVAAHLDSCKNCTAEFAQWRAMQQALTVLGPAKAPADLALRLRVALSQQAARSSFTWRDRLELAWKNSFAPIALQVSAGFASAVLLLGTVVLALGVVGAPEQAVADDSPTGAATAPHFLYASPGSGQQLVLTSADGNPIVVQALVNSGGFVYDYRVVSGHVDENTRTALANKLLFSKFEPATLFGQPTRGRVLLSFTGISVHS